MLENINLCVKVVPLEEVIGTKQTFGDFALNPDTYYETYSLFGKGVYEFIGVVENGAVYCAPAVVYDKVTATCRMNGMRFNVEDGVCFLFNKVFEKDFLVNVRRIELNNPEALKEVHGNYATDPDNYYETYSMHGASAYDFIGVSVNGMFYAHSQTVSFDKPSNTLTIKSLPLTNSDNITLFYNAR